MSKSRLVRLVAAMVTLTSVSACVTPRVVSYYDDKCQVMARRVELDVVQLGALGSCSNAGCSAEVLGAIAVVATSTIVSGSVAVVGNVAYWAEKRANCKRELPAPVPVPASASAPAP